MQLREKARLMGVDPLEVMMNEIRDLMREASAIGKSDALDDDEQIAKAAAHRRALRTQAVEVATRLAPYLHAKLASIEFTGDDDKPIRIEHTEARDLVTRQIAGLITAIQANGHDSDGPEPPEQPN